MAETHIQIGDITPRIQYTGDGAQTLFTYPFPIFQAADMEVCLDDVKQATGFTVNGAGQSAGGDVTFDTAPANGMVVTLRRRLAIQRTSDFQESGEFRSKVINDELDYLTAALQQVSDDGDRTLRLGATDPMASLTLPDKAARTNMYLGFDANGDPIATDASGPVGPTGPAGADGSYTSVGDGLAEITASQIAVDLAATPGLEFSGGQLQAKVDSVTISRTAGGLLVPAGGIGTNELALSTIAQAEAEAGTATTERLFTAQRVKQAIDALALGRLTVVGTAVASASASLTITGLDSTYDTYAVGFSDLIPVTDNVAPWLRVGAGSIDSGSTDYSWGQIGLRLAATPSTQDAGDDQDAQIELCHTVANVGNNAGATGDGFGGMLFLHRPGDGNSWPMFSGTTFALDDSGPIPIMHLIGGCRRSVINLDRIQFLFSSGNIASGRLTVWGYNHA